MVVDSNSTSGTNNLSLYSNGRMPVSKIVRCGFESYEGCQVFWVYDNGSRHRSERCSGGSIPPTQTKYFLGVAQLVWHPLNFTKYGKEGSVMQCKFCSKECKNHNSHRNHERLCRDNPNRQLSNFRFNTVTWNKGLTKEDPRVAKYAKGISESTKGRPNTTVWTDEMRKQKSEWRKQYHKDHPDAHPNRKLAGNRGKMSYPERVAFDWLTTKGVAFLHQKKIGEYYPDFVVGNLIIEIDGEYWHNPTVDAEKDKMFNSLGYTVKRIKAKQRIEEELENLRLV